MTLSGEHTALFTLLRAGLWEKEPDDLSAFPLTDTQWWEVYRMAVRQTVVGIVWRGLHHLPDPLLPGDAMMIRWVAKADSIERRSRQMNAVTLRLLRLMEENGLHPILLKGQSVATLYEHPLMRQCGDIDLYFPSKDEELRAAHLMESHACTMEQRPDGSRCYSWQGVEVEHHSHLFDLHTPWLHGYLSSLIRQHGFTNQSLSHQPADTASVPAPLLCLLLLDAHMLKHLMGNGLGLRQFCDMARAYHTLRGNYSPAELEAVYRRTGLLKWNLQLHAFLVSHLGLSPHDLPYACTENTASPRLLHIILDGGNFGQYRESGGKVFHSGWERKLWTFFSFWKHRDFSYAYAPAEAFWTSLKLMIGNLK